MSDLPKSIDTRSIAIPEAKGKRMEFPEIITRLPEVDLPIPSTTVRTSLLQSDQGQLVFFQIMKDVELPAHSHKGQWGTVLEGMVELTVSGKTKLHQAGSS